jgi:uncharacterized protein (DUF697 family)
MADSAAAEQVIRQHVVWSVGAGLVPLPVVDFVAVTAIQVDLIRQLCTLHGTNYSEASGKTLVGALTGSALARFGASAIKALPGIGSVLGGVSMSIASGASTWGVGQVVHRHLASGGSLTDLNVEKARQEYEAEYERGKEVAREASHDGGSKDVFERLNKLGDLKAKGIITEAEFEAKKKELLARV